MVLHGRDSGGLEAHGASMTVEYATVPCATCGTSTRMLGTQRCDNCYEVESRLVDYLRRGGTKAFRAVMQAYAISELSNPDVFAELAAHLKKDVGTK